MTDAERMHMYGGHGGHCWNTGSRPAGWLGNEFKLFMLNSKLTLNKLLVTKVGLISPKMAVIGGKHVVLNLALPACAAVRNRCSIVIMITA